MSKIRFRRRTVLIAISFVLLIAIVFFLWWIGLFLPNQIEWKNKKFCYEGMNVLLENRKISIRERSNAFTAPIYKTNWDQSVQDVLHYDIDDDGNDELVMLVWKHGSYGNHLPNWVKHNDIRLEQHIFIYRYDQTRENKLRAVWMSSTLGDDISSISQGADHRLRITDIEGTSRTFKWQDFGLKLEDIVLGEVSFACVGDNLIHTNLLQQGRTTYDFLYENIKDEIEGVDIASVNQETVLVKDPGLISNYPRFGSPIEIGEAIVNAGFDIITLANNHALDKESYGVDTSLDFFRQYQGVTCVGTHSSSDTANSPEDGVHFLLKNGLKIAVLNYTYGTNGIPSPEENPYMVERFSEEQRMITQLDYARANADAVIVFAHWGTEYSNEIDSEQVRLSKLMLKHHVDVIIGTHPHVIQPFEMLTGTDGHQMLVYYSLGNFLSGQAKPECQIGGIARFYIVQTSNGAVKVKDYSLQSIVTEKSKAGYTVSLLEEKHDEGDKK